ncbi:MAG: DegT/DnrJ/EryC1/StrS family aminotransferase [Candidatus Lokiarchaeota archaeon]|nr:DegT/DnrJ/EryC1/StrS family aminotransferase [Candidatus Lokiarchaeota archaeon]
MAKGNAKPGEQKPARERALPAAKDLCLPREFPGAIHYGKEEEEAALRVIRSQSPFRYYGPRCGFEVKQFEAEFARFIASDPGKPWPEDSEHLVTAVNSGTGALEVALDALGVGCGDEVITQGFMWVSTISAIVRNRAVPVLVDSDGTMNMDPESLKDKMSDRTKVVIPVPMLGGCARIGRIMAVIREVNEDRAERDLQPVRVLEDNAQSLGAHATGCRGSVTAGKEGTYRIGTFGDAAIFSLQINKNITAGEGGVIVTRDRELHKRVEALHNAGFSKDLVAPAKNWYGDEPVGWGQGRRMTEMQAAIARVQLRKLDTIIARMRASHDRLEARVRQLGLTPRMRADAVNPGDTGYYCIFHLPWHDLSDDDKIRRGREIAAELGEYALHPWFMHDFEIHVYYNVPQLVGKWPMNNGCPWACCKNAFHALHKYSRGTLPRLDEMLLTSVGVNVPSQLTEVQEERIAAVLEAVHARHVKLA